MHREIATYVAARLRERGVRAQTTWPGHQVAVQVTLPDERIAYWQGGQVTGYEALLYLHGSLIGAVPPARGSGAWTPDDLVDAIAAAGYGGPEHRATHTPAPATGPARLMVRQHSRSWAGHLTRI